MPVMSDRWIRKMAREEGMIEPFAEGSRDKNVISYGLSAYGYDFRLHDEFRIWQPPAGAVIDPKNHEDDWFQDFQGDVCIIPPNSMVLGRTVEYFRIPRRVLTICYGKSTYARCGILINVTPFEPEWEGFATLSIANTTTHPAKIYAHQGIAQLLFLEGNEPCETSYRDKKGRYQAQKDITPPRS